MPTLYKHYSRDSANEFEPVFGVVLNKALYHVVAYTTFVSLLFI